MINQYTITSDAWTQITQPGETGVCWLDDDLEEEFQAVVYDDLTGLTFFNVVVQGHVVED